MHISKQGDGGGITSIQQNPVLKKKRRDVEPHQKTEINKMGIQSLGTYLIAEAVCKEGEFNGRNACMFFFLLPTNNVFPNVRMNLKHVCGRRCLVRNLCWRWESGRWFYHPRPSGSCH
jgi:hypothetical protein